MNPHPSRGLTRAQQIETTQAEQAYQRLDMMRNNTLVLNEDGLAALTPQPMKTASRIDFQSVAVTAQGSIGKVAPGFKVRSAQAFPSPSPTMTPLSCNPKAMVNAGVEAEFLFGLVGVGTEVTVEGGGCSTF